MGLNKPSRTTPLFVDMDLSTQLLHRSHGEFLQLTRTEKKKLRLYYQVRVQKDKDFEQQQNIRTKIQE